MSTCNRKSFKHHNNIRIDFWQAHIYIHRNKSMQNKVWISKIIRRDILAHFCREINSAGLARAQSATQRILHNKSRVICLARTFTGRARPRLSNALRDVHKCIIRAASKTKRASRALPLFYGFTFLPWLRATAVDAACLHVGQSFVRIIYYIYRPPFYLSPSPSLSFSLALLSTRAKCQSARW